MCFALKYKRCSSSVQVFVSCHENCFTSLLFFFKDMPFRRTSTASTKYCGGVLHYPFIITLYISQLRPPALSNTCERLNSICGGDMNLIFAFLQIAYVPKSASSIFTTKINVGYRKMTLYTAEVGLLFALFVYDYN